MEVDADVEEGCLCGMGMKKGNWELDVQSLNLKTELDQRNGKEILKQS